MAKGLAIATITHNSLPAMGEFFEDLAQVAGELGAPLIVVDNASSDGSADFAESHSGNAELVLERNADNLGYAVAVNQAFAAAGDRDVVTVNPDVDIENSADVERLHGFLAEQPRAGVVAPRLLEADGTVQSSARPFPSIPAMAAHGTFVRHLRVGSSAADRYLRPPSGDGPVRVDWAIGAVQMIRREAFESVGGFDESFFLYLEDTDFCLRCARAGWETWYLPEVALKHDHPRASDPEHGSVVSSAARRHHMRSMMRFFRRYPRLAFRGQPGGENG